MRFAPPPERRLRGAVAARDAELRQRHLRGSREDGRSRPHLQAEAHPRAVVRRDRRVGGRVGDREEVPAGGGVAVLRRDRAALLDDAQKLGMEITYVSGEELEQLITDLMNTPADIVAKMGELTK